MWLIILRPGYLVFFLPSRSGVTLRLRALNLGNRIQAIFRNTSTYPFLWASIALSLWRLACMIHWEYSGMS